MRFIFGLNDNGVKPRPTYEEFINFVEYLVKILARSAIVARGSPLLTQLDGIAMMNLEELERIEIIERCRELCSDRFLRILGPLLNC